MTWQLLLTLNSPSPGIQVQGRGTLLHHPSEGVIRELRELWRVRALWRSVLERRLGCDAASRAVDPSVSSDGVPEGCAGLLSTRGGSIAQPHGIPHHKGWRDVHAHRHVARDGAQEPGCEHLESVRGGD